MKIVFFGSSKFSLQALRACVDSSHQLLLAITTPDQKKGRGLKLMPTVVRQYCQEHDLPVEAFENLKDPLGFDKTAQLAPDLFVVSSYGKMIPSTWLKIPSKLALNVHPSLLPQYRGASPLNWPIINGDSETGITIAEVTKQLDSGDIFFQQRIPLDPLTNSEKLSRRLAELSYAALLEVFKQIEQGTLKRIVQDEKISSYARKLTKEDGHLLFTDSALHLDRLIRGLQPWPGAFFYFQKEPLHILDAEPSADSSEEKPGTLIRIESNGSISVATGKGVLKLNRVRPAGKKEMPAADFARGRHLVSGSVFESSSNAGSP